MFSLPSGFISSTTQMVAQTFLDLKELLILGLGIAMGFWVINRVIDSIKKGMR